MTCDGQDMWLRRNLQGQLRRTHESPTGRTEERWKLIIRFRGGGHHVSRNTRCLAARK